MRILHSESSIGWGGQENRILNEMLALRERGHEMALLCRPGARLGERARGEGFAVFEAEMGNVLKLTQIWRLRGLIASWRPDVLNTHSGRDTQMAGLAARLLGPRRPRVVRTRHLALPITSRFTYNTLVDHVVTVSAFVADFLARSGVRREQLSVVPTGIDFTRFEPVAGGGGLRAELNLAPDTPLVGTVAILRMKKGHLDLLDAIPRVLERQPNCHFVFAGDGPMREALEARVRELGLESRVHFLGLRRDVANVLQSLDLFVLPTHQEALGTALIEAAIQGLAAVGTRVDGVPEVVRDGETGLLVPPHDSAALAAAIVELLCDPERRRSMGATAARHAREHYSIAGMAEGMLVVYRRLLEPR
jgi:glycosyltransferase involved in cell wall biosynthesis